VTSPDRSGAVRPDKKQERGLGNAKKQAVGAQVDRTDYCCLSADVVCPGHG